MNSLANSVTRLKWSAVAFALLWTGWKFWWSGDYDRVNVTMLTICGALAGYFWYRIMRWHFQRRSLPPRDVHSPGSAAK
jgi:glycopeptide antibiotics resistance protein